MWHINLHILYNLRTKRHIEIEELTTQLNKKMARITNLFKFGNGNYYHQSIFKDVMHLTIFQRIILTHFGIQSHNITEISSKDMYLKSSFQIHCFFCPFKYSKTQNNPVSLYLRGFINNILLFFFNIW